MNQSEDGGLRGESHGSGAGCLSGDDAGKAAVAGNLAGISEVDDKTVIALSSTEASLGVRGEFSSLRGPVGSAESSKVPNSSASDSTLNTTNTDQTVIDYEKGSVEAESASVGSVAGLSSKQIGLLTLCETQSQIEISDGESSLCTNTSRVSKNEKNRKRKLRRKQKKLLNPTAKTDSEISGSKISLSTVKAEPKDSSFLKNQTQMLKDGPKAEPCGDDATTKRKRLLAVTPVSDEADSKKSKNVVDQTPNSNNDLRISYSDVASNSLYHVVYVRVNSEEQFMSYTAGEHIKNELSRLQYCFEQKLSGFTPRFHRTIYHSNELKFECACEESQKWLLRVVPKIPVYEGMNFVAYTPENVPRLSNFTIFFHRKEKVEARELLSRLQCSNPKLHTQRWRVLFGADREAGHVLGVGIDPASLSELKRLDMRPFFEMGRASVYELKPKNVKTDDSENGGL